MRAPRIPTESYSLSIGLGALIPFAMVFAINEFPDRLRVIPVLLSPFICGFTAILTFGAVERSGIRHCLTIATFAFLAFYSLLVISAIFLGFRLSQELGGLVYVMALFPPFLLVPVIVSMIGSIFGWLAALAIRR